MWRAPIHRSQCRIDAEESISTLRFGTRAKTVKNRAVVNVQKSNDELEAQLDALRRYAGVLEAENKRLRSTPHAAVMGGGGGGGDSDGGGRSPEQSLAEPHGEASRANTATAGGGRRDKTAPAAAVADAVAGGGGGVGGTSFVELDMECQALRRRVKLSLIHI